jgi:hypothetical protein
MEVLLLNNNRVLSSLCYFSIFFAGFILPLIVFFVVNEPDVKRHAKRAFISHLLLLVPTIIGIIIFVGVIIFYGFEPNQFGSNSFTGDGLLMIAWLLFIVLEAVLSLVVFIWNIVQGIKVLKV